MRPDRKYLRSFSIVAVLALGLSLITVDVEARRLGSGSSIGRQSSTMTQRQGAPVQQNAATPTQSTAPASPPPAAPQGNRWLGPIAGIAAGLGIAALLSHFGIGGAFGEGLSSIMMIGLLVLAGVFVWRMLRPRPAASTMRAMEPAYAAATPVEKTRAQTSSFTSVADATSGAVVAGGSWGVPADFDVAGFVRNAKVNFIRLQAAWDAKNLVDIREFTTPEMFAELKMQISETSGNNQTDVVTLEAELLGIDTNEFDYLASVRFSGALREDQAKGAEAFEEVWNLSKPKDGKSGWLLAGIQQVH